MDSDTVKKAEDTVRETIDGLSEYEQAIAYFYLYSSGWSVEKSQQVRQRGPE